MPYLGIPRNVSGLNLQDLHLVAWDNLSHPRRGAATPDEKTHQIPETHGFHIHGNHVFWEQKSRRHLTQMAPFSFDQK